MINLKFFPSRQLAFYMARLFVTRSLAVLVALILILMTLDLLGESGKSLAVPGNGDAELWRYVALRIPLLVSRFLPFSVLLGALIAFVSLNQHSEVVAMKAAWSGEPITLATDTLGAESNATDKPSFPALGAPVLAEFAGRGNGFQMLAPAAGLGKFLDNQLPARQSPAENHLGAWDVTNGDGSVASGAFRAAFPLVVNDLQFFGAPAIADLTGDRLRQGTNSVYIGSQHYHPSAGCDADPVNKKRRARAHPVRCP